MNTEKLLKVLIDIRDEEKLSNISGAIQSLTAQLNNVQEYSKIKDDLYSKLRKSVVNGYIYSDKKVLKELKGDRFFGDSALEQLETFLHLPTTEIPSALNKYLSERSAFLQASQKVLEGLNQFQLKPHIYTDEEKYDISIIFPDEIKIISEKIDQWQEFLHQICEYELGKKEKINISFANSGCLELSVLITSPAVVLLIAKSLKEIANFIKEITEIQKNIAETENLKIDKKLKQLNIENLQKANSEKLKEAVEIIVQRIFPVKDGKHEDNTKISIGIKRIIKNLQQNIKIEITPPRVSELKLLSDDTDENKKQNQKLRKDYEKKIEIIKPVEIANLEIEKIEKRDIDLLAIPEEFYSDNDKDRKKKA